MKVMSNWEGGRPSTSIGDLCVVLEGPNSAMQLLVKEQPLFDTSRDTLVSALSRCREGQSGAYASFLAFLKITLVALMATHA